jgi:isopentenyl-diphosphate delta-isomerase
VPEGALRRLWEEMGIRCGLTGAGHFAYRAELGNGLVEHELDHVLFGVCDAEPRPDPAEVEGWKWCPVEELEGALRDRPESFTAWLPIAWVQIAARVRPPAVVTTPEG